jgi:hypothetical protein
MQLSSPWPSTSTTLWISSSKTLPFPRKMRIRSHIFDENLRIYSIAYILSRRMWPSYIECAKLTLKSPFYVRDSCILWLSHHKSDLGLVIANLRCGAWYTDPVFVGQEKVLDFASFKYFPSCRRPTCLHTSSQLMVISITGVSTFVVQIFISFHS